MRFSHDRLFLFLAVVLTVIVLTGCQPAPAPTRVPSTTLPQLTPTVEAPADATTAQEPQAAQSGYPHPAPEGGAAEPVGYPVGTPGGEITGALEGTPEPPGGIPLEGYPAPEQGNDSPGNAPVVDNRAKITGTISTVRPDPDSPGFVRLVTQLLTSEEIEGLPNFTQELVGSQVVLYIDANLLGSIGKDDRFEAVVQMVGDETVQKFMVIEIKKLE